MIDATLSRVRLRDLAGLGRSRTTRPGGAGPRRPSASRPAPRAPSGAALPAGPRGGGGGAAGARAPPTPPRRPGRRQRRRAIGSAAPASLTTVNADGDEAISADSPAVAAATCTSPPHAMPSAETSPALRPLS